MKGYYEYLTNLAGLVEKVRDQQGESICRAARVLADAVERGSRIYFWGPGGHSSIFAEDVMYREGELACICPIVDPNISLGHGALKEVNYYERIVGMGKTIIKYNRVGAGDVMVIGSAYGVNPVCIEGAMEAKRLGATVVAITSAAFANTLDNAETRHDTGKSLHEIADVYIDSYSPADDLCLKKENFAQKYGPVGTIMQLLTLKALTTTTITELIDRGVDVPIWRNALEKGGPEFNEKYMNNMWCVVKCL